MTVLLIGTGHRYSVLPIGTRALILAGTIRTDERLITARSSEPIPPILQTIMDPAGLRVFSLGSIWFCT
ncbi:hypothetical protein IF2G_11115 [Cordyceps javanica]|nr:hypothetical protein IF2G_11115 [Cordyceps javanica]